METEEQLIELGVTLRKWLKTRPQKADIRAYLKQLSEEYYPTVDFACLLQLDTFMETLHMKWSELGWNVRMVMPPISELELFTSLQQYNAESVIEGFKKRFPELTAPSVPADISNWALSLQGEWFSINATLTEMDYLKRIPLFHTLHRIKKERGDINPVLSTVADIIGEDARMTEAGHLPEKTEAEAQAAKFRGLAIFPEEYIAKLIDPVFYEEKALVLSSFVLAGEVLSAIGDQNIENMQLFEETLWDYLYDQTATESIEYLEKEYYVRPPQEREMLEWLSVNWHPAAIRDDTFATAANAYTAPMTPGDRQMFNRLFLIHVANSPVTQVMLAPLDARHLIDRFKRTKGNILLMRNILLDAVKDILDENERALAIKTCEYIFQFM